MKVLAVTVAALLLAASGGASSATAVRHSIEMKGAPGSFRVRAARRTRARRSRSGASKPKAVTVAQFLGMWKSRPRGTVLDIFYIGKQPCANLNSRDFTFRIEGNTLRIFKGKHNLKYDPASKDFMRATLINGGKQIVLRTAHGETIGTFEK